MKYKVGDKVRFVKNVGSVSSSDCEMYFGKIFTIKDAWCNGRNKYQMEGLPFWYFVEEELEEVNVSWLEKQYEILYFRGGKYREGMELNKNILTAKGTLIGFDTPFTGRFFLKNENGGLEIIAMQSVVEMREIV